MVIHNSPARKSLKPHHTRAEMYCARVDTAEGGYHFSLFLSDISFDEYEKNETNTKKLFQYIMRLHARDLA